MKTLLITPGDPKGIGSEVLVKALKKIAVNKHSIIIIGSKEPFKRSFSDSYRWIEPPLKLKNGAQAGWSIECATQMALQAPNEYALVTGPIHKKRLQEGGYPYQGHTDFLAKLCNVKNPTMMLCNDFFRVALVTHHCPLSEVSSKITKSLLHKTLKNCISFLNHQLQKNHPKIAVLGLNPHAGENGVLGLEEQKVIIPALTEFTKKNKKLTLSGPHSADSFFSHEMKTPKKLKHDMIIAQYHDQGLIPLKLMGFHKSVNVTLGLPIIRTSVDHGTAFDIVGKNIANPDSMILAIKLALNFLKYKNKETQI